MATVLERRPGDRTSENENGRSANSATVLTDNPNPKMVLLQRSEVEEYKVIFLIDGEGMSPKAFDLAIDTAKAFSAKLILTYLIGNEEIPDGYREYAKAEGISDYEAGYYDLVANSKLASLGERAEAEGLEWSTSLYFGNAKKATKYYTGDKKSIVIVNKPAEKSIFERLFGRSRHV